MGRPARIDKARQNRLGDSVGIFPHLAVPEPHDPPAKLFEKDRPRRVAFGVFDMLAAVDFDGHLCCTASEIKNVAPDRKLSREARAGVAQAFPPTPDPSLPGRGEEGGE